MSKVLARRFEVLRPLGRGGLAEVLAARDLSNGQEVAVKILHPHLARIQAVADRFRREVAVLRELKHPGIVRGFEQYEHSGRPLFAMELLRGESLADRMDKGLLPVRESRRIAREVALALSAAHRAGIVHRD